jgi:hypothetical protein
MPQYLYHCDHCRTRETRIIPFAQFDAQKNEQFCADCKRRLELQTFTTDTMPTFIGRQKPGSGLKPRSRGFDHGPNGFNRGSDDGFGNDNASRQMARKIAAKAGVGVAGARFHPGLAARGKMFDPNAWIRSDGEARAQAQRIGADLHGLIEFEHTPHDSFYEANEESKRDRPSEDAVKFDVMREVKEQHGGNVTRKQAREITEKMQDKYTRTKYPVVGPPLEKLLGWRDK